MASSRLNCAMLRLGHPGSLSYSCEQSRAARRRFAQKHGSTDTSAISILHHHFDGQFMVHSMPRRNGHACTCSLASSRTRSAESVGRPGSLENRELADALRDAAKRVALRLGGWHQPNPQKVANQKARVKA